MNTIEESEKLINTAWSLFKEIPLGREHLENLSALKVKLHQPCELAIAGKVKAGKSSFLNALIGEELAQVGDLETTATINRFCYGKPENPRRPVKVVWDDGKETYEPLEFMNSLQGFDDKVLDVASRISYLEYRVDNPLLRELTLVDTPGTGAVVDTHQEVAERYFNLREKHKEQTRRCTAHADAVVYLLGAVPNIRDKSHLDDFRKNTEDGMPLNAIGVLSKVDIDMQLLANRNEQAQYLADSLKDQLATVVPVSAGLYKVLKDKEHLFPEWHKLLRKIEKTKFSLMLKGEKLFLLPTYSNIPVETRKNMIGDIPWSIFRTIVSVLYDVEDVKEAVRRLYDIANIDEVRRIVEDYFFKRSKSIRCANVLAELYSICLKVLSTGIFKLRIEDAKFAKWQRFVSQYKDCSDVNGLLDYLATHHKGKSDIDRLELEIRTNLKSPIEQLRNSIIQDDYDFQMLVLMQNNRAEFSEDEYDEFRCLFSRFSGDGNLNDKQYVAQRIDFWRGEEFFITSGLKRQIIRSAIDKYNLIYLKEI